MPGSSGKKDVRWSREWEKMGRKVAVERFPLFTRGLEYCDGGCQRLSKSSGYDPPSVRSFPPPTAELLLQSLWRFVEVFSVC